MVSASMKIAEDRLFIAGNENISLGTEIPESSFK